MPQKSIYKCSFDKATEIIKLSVEFVLLMIWCLGLIIEINQLLKKMKIEQKGTPPFTEWRSSPGSCLKN